MKPNDPAFPIVYKDSSDTLRVHLGITQRDYLAAVVAGHVMAATRATGKPFTADAVAVMAYELANALQAAANGS